MATPSEYSSVSHSPGFINLWINQIFVQLAYNSLNFALLIWVFRLTGSNAATSILMLAIYLPAVLFGLFAGVLVDITDRKLVISTINLSLALALFSLILFKNHYSLVLLITFLVNTLAQFYMAAEASAIPLVTKKEQLLAANSIFQTTIFMTFLVGFGLAGPVINLWGIDFVFGLGGVLLLIGFALSILMPSLVGKMSLEGVKLRASLKNRDFQVFRQMGIDEIKKTLRIIKGKPGVVVAILIISVEQAIIGILGVLVPSFFERVLHINATDSSYVLITPLGLGMVAGGLVVGKFGIKLPKRRIIGSGITLAGSLLGLVGLGPILSPVVTQFSSPRPFFHLPSYSSLLVAGFFLLGIAFISVIVPSQTIIQEQTPESDRGKVFAVLSVVMSAVAIGPVLLAGILSDLFSPSWIFLMIGLVILSAGLGVLRRNSHAT